MTLEGARDARLETGRGGEAFVANYLRGKGMTICATDVLFGRMGQIDLIAKDRSTLWAIEVKTRHHESAYGGLSDVLHPPQITRLQRCLTLYAREHRWDGPLGICLAKVSVDHSSQQFQLKDIIRVL